MNMVQLSFSEISMVFGGTDQTNQTSLANSTNNNCGGFIPEGLIPTITKYLSLWAGCCHLSKRTMRPKAGATEQILRSVTLFVIIISTTYVIASYSLKWDELINW